LEAVKIWLKAKRKGIHKAQPPYTSVYLSYRGERQVRLRIGTDNEEEFRQLAAPYFTSEGAMRPEAIHTIQDFFREATKLNDTFCWYSDSSPEATQKLVDSIVEKDEATGQTSLRIPVADKEMVVNALNLIGKLLGGKL
jgi:hypothetical protein